MSKPLSIILLVILSICAFAQEAPRERFLVTQPGESAAFQRHPGQTAPGRGFAFRYRFEGNNGRIHEICRQITAESPETYALPEEEDGSFPDPGEVRRLNEDLLQEALLSLDEATGSSPLTASETNSPSPE